MCFTFHLACFCSSAKVGILESLKSFRSLFSTPSRCTSRQYPSLETVQQTRQRSDLRQRRVRKRPLNAKGSMISQSPTPNVNVRKIQLFNLVLKRNINSFIFKERSFDSSRHLSWCNFNKLCKTLKWTIQPQTIFQAMKITHR